LVFGDDIMRVRVFLAVHVLIMASWVMLGGCSPASDRGLAAPSGQSSAAPFSEMLARARSPHADWYEGDTTEKNVLFHRERRRLGARFEGELMKLVAGNAGGHYWCANFLAWGDPASGAEPDLKLALLLYGEGLILCEKLPAPDNEARASPMAVNAAVAAWKLGLNTLAIRYKSRAEKAMASLGDMGSACFPVMEEAEHNLYEAIPKE